MAYVEDSGSEGDGANFVLRRLRNTGILTQERKTETKETFTGRARPLLHPRSGARSIKKSHLIKAQ